MDDLSVMAYEMRKDVLDMICRAGTGHIGGDFSVMEILTDLYFRQMNISPELMDDRDRDRFVLSKGHSVESYYAVLARKGFFDIEEVKARFSAFNSPYIGHPNNKLPGIEMNSGSLGHGDVYKRQGYDYAISIEHEDSLMSQNEGLSKAVEFLKQCITFEDVSEMWWA